MLSEQHLPKARQSLEVARSGYLAGQIDFFNLTDSERTLLGFELGAVEASAAKEILLAELSLVLQGMSPASGETAASTVTASGGSNARRPAAGAMNSMR